MIDFVFGERMSYKKTIDASEDEVEKIVVDLLGRATQSVDYSTGLFAEFYSRPAVMKAFENAAGKVGSFRLLLDSIANLDDLKSNPDLAWVFRLQNGVKFEMRKSPEKISHRIIVDNRDFRLESDDSTPGKWSNFVLKNADDSVKDISSEIISGFNEDWDSSRPIQ